MNKTIKEAQYVEIANSLKSGAYKTIAEKRKKNLCASVVDCDTGECELHSKYGIKKALNDNLGLEFRLSQSNHMRKVRIKERIQAMLDTNRCYFLTLTFSDKMFERKATAETRRRYIRRFLKSECSQYVANIDFGSTNEREHYHAVVVPKTLIHFDKYRKEFDSNINCKRVVNNAKTKDKVAMYIAKLTNHALKENGFYKRLIYSRNTKK